MTELTDKQVRKLRQNTLRDYIDASRIIDKMQKHIHRELPKSEMMTKDDIAIANVLLKKAVPDLRAIDVTAQVEVDSVINVNILAQEDIVED